MYFLRPKTYIILHPSIHSFTHLRKRIELLYAPDPMLGSRGIKSTDRLSRSRAGKETKRKERVETNVNTNARIVITQDHGNTGDGVSLSQ